MTTMYVQPSGSMPANHSTSVYVLCAECEKRSSQSYFTGDIWIMHACICDLLVYFSLVFLPFSLTLLISRRNEMHCFSYPNQKWARPGRKPWKLNDRVCAAHGNEMRGSGTVHYYSLQTKFSPESTYFCHILLEWWLIGISFICFIRQRAHGSLHETRESHAFMWKVFNLHALKMGCLITSGSRLFIRSQFWLDLVQATDSSFPIWPQLLSSSDNAVVWVCYMGWEYY